MRALGYFVADNEAGDEDPLSRHFQEGVFLRYCRDHQHNPVGTFIDAQDDDAKPEYQRMVQHIRDSGKGFLLVIIHPEHLGSDLEEGVRRFLELDVLHTEVVCADEHMPDPLQGLLRVWAASSSSAARRERIREAMQAKAVRGEGLGKPPYGYRLGTKGKLEPVPDEAEVVRLIYQQYIEEGLGVRSIARRLNEEGRTTRRGYGWSMVTIRDVLRNHTYIGTYTRFGLRIPSSHPRIVSPEEFRLVQSRMRERSPVRKHPQAQPFLLSGLVYCGQCGNRMMAVTRRQVWRRKDGERVRGQYRYYQCQSRTNRSQCQYHTWRAPELDSHVVARVRQSLQMDDGDEPLPMATSPVDEAAAERERGRLRSLRRRYLELVQRAAGGAISLGRLRGLLAQVDAGRADAHRRLAACTADPEQVAQQHQEYRRRLQQEWERLPLEAQQEILHSLVQRVTVRGRDVEVGLRT